MLLKGVLLVFFSFYTLDINMQKECESERDKISGCIEKNILYKWGSCGRKTI